MANITSDMADGQGLNKDLWHVATVVNNNDPEKLGRIQAKVEETLEGIPDEDLPWAIPAGWNHCDGAFSSSGLVAIPKVGTKVHVQFQKGNPKYPMYKGYHADKQTMLQEAEMNYPDRAVARFQNNSLMVVDTKENIIYLRSPGDLRICVVGDLQIEIYGNVTEHIHGNVVRKIDGNLDETVTGNKSLTVEGTANTLVHGSSNTQSLGDMTLATSGSMNQAASGNTTHRAGGTLALEGAAIHENSGVGAAPPAAVPAAKAVELKDWPGIRGGAHGDTPVKSGK